MTLPLPPLDDRTYADLVDEARALIPTYQREWTNYNPSDPGITLIELFAWLAEMLIYRADQVPDRHRLVFLRLLKGPAWRPTEAPLDDQIAATLTELRSRHRAVTVDDYERLSREVPRVARALCLPRRDLGQGEEEGRLAHRPGYVSVVVLPGGDVPAAEVDAVRGAVAAHLEPRRLLTTQHVIADPVWAPVTTEVLVAPRPDVPEGRVRTAVVEALTTFLDPRRGGQGGRGWRFGRDVYVSELHGVLEGLPEVDYVPDLQLASTCAANAKRCAEAEEEWDEHGDQVGLRLAPHHLPSAAIDPAAVVVSDAFVPVRARVTLAPAAGVAASEARRKAKAALRVLFHPLHDGPGGGPWSLGSDLALTRLRSKLRGVASVSGVGFEGRPPWVTTGERDVVTVQLAEGELADVQAEIVVA